MNTFEKISLFGTIGVGMAWGVQEAGYMLIACCALYFGASVVAHDWKG